MEPMEALAATLAASVLVAGVMLRLKQTPDGRSYGVAGTRRLAGPVLVEPGLQLIPLRNDLQAKRTQKQPMGQKLK